MTSEKRRTADDGGLDLDEDAFVVVVGARAAESDAGAEPDDKRKLLGLGWRSVGSCPRRYSTWSSVMESLATTFPMTMIERRPSVSRTETLEARPSLS